jgi:hypothetical protein
MAALPRLAAAGIVSVNFPRRLELHQRYRGQQADLPAMDRSNLYFRFSLIWLAIIAGGTVCLLVM